MATSFNAEDFMSEPDQDVFDSLRKDDLLALSLYLNLSVKKSWRKIDIQRVIVKHLISIDVFDGSSLSSYCVASDIEIKKLEINAKLEFKKLENEREREREEREREREEREREIELKKLELQNNFELKKLETEIKVSHTDSESKFDVTKFIRLVPPFQEKDVDQYYLHFEKIANSLKWPKEFWCLLLQSVFVGKAREIHSQLSVVQASDYDYVKELILKGYELVPEAYRQRFRNCQKESNQTYVEFARKKEQLFDRWCNSKKVNQNHENLRELMLIEEFKRCIHHDIRTFLDDQKADTLENASRLADDYALTHKSSFVSRPPQSYGRNVRTSENSNVNKSQLYRSDRATGQKVESSSSRSHSAQDKSYSSAPVCRFCRKEGHIMSDCFKLKQRRQGQNDSKPTGFISKTCNLPSNVNDVRGTILEEKSSCVSVMQSFEPFIHNGFVSLSSDLTNSNPVKILRDTGASQSLLLANTLPFSDVSFTGTNVLIKGVDSTEFTSIPLHNAYLSSDLVSGHVVVGILLSLPFDGVHLLLGNDLAGSKVEVNPLVTDKPSVDPNTDSIEQEIPGIFPSCAVTRSMTQSKSTSDDVTTDVDLADTFLSRVINDDNVSDVTNDDFSAKAQTFSRSDLIREQNSDPDVSCLFARSVDECDVSRDPVCFYTKNDVLMRKWRPSDVPADDEWAVKHQIVVPSSYRPHILSLAHDTPMSGHLGINKTYQRILEHFYWPNLRKDVVEFCRSCHTCQMVGKPNQTLPKAALQPIPAFEEPFSRVIIDCVGPLPKTKSGNQYLLTVMCASTRFPEAIPLRNISAKTIVKALIKFFTFVGLPKSIQSDQGSNFMSGLFQQVMDELGIKQYRSSAYHPESQGALERFHQTLKNMIRSYCFDTNRDWDEGVHLLLFAVRESVQESLGFSPFELVFGHSVRGPLKLFKEKLLSHDDVSLNLLQYVSDFRTKLSNACEMAKANLKSAQNSMKNRYDQNSVSRTFKPGDKVLALLPVPGRPLQARYFGPYIVDKKMSDLNYVLQTPDRRKQKQLCHINMLKPYYTRKGDNVKPVQTIVTDPAENDCNFDENFDVHSGTAKLNNSEILRNIDSKLAHLTQSQQQDLKELFSEYKQLFSDVPSRTDTIIHDVDVGDAQPIKQHPYRLNLQKEEYLKNEVQYLLDNDFVEPSQSNWSSPCLLVPKPDQSYRMCTDFRKLNSVTKTDTFPIPRIDDCIDKVGKAKYVTKIDLLKGFYQVPLTERAKELSAFVTPSGLYQYKVMAFQRLINSVTSGIDGCDAYIDDAIIYSDTWEEHLSTIRQFYDRLSEAKLTINLSKSEFACATVTFLGHVVGQGQIKPFDSKVCAIDDFPRPENKKQLMRFLGMAGYYRKFCPNFSTISEPLTQLLKKTRKFVWSDDCEKSFVKLKAILKSSPVLQAPDFYSQFKLAVDASDVAAGAVLLQEGSDGIDHQICYFSRKFNKNQRNYSTVEKECLALILALQHFEVYVTSSSFPIIVYSDHNPLVFLHKLRSKNQRLLRWSLMLQEFNIIVKHIRGKDNLIADCLSRL